MQSWGKKSYTLEVFVRFYLRKTRLIFYKLTFKLITMSPIFLQFGRDNGALQFGYLFEKSTCSFPIFLFSNTISKSFMRIQETFDRF